MKESSAPQRQAGDIDISFGNDGHIHPSSEPGRTFNLACDENGVVTYAIELSGKILVGRALANGEDDETFNAEKWNFAKNDKSRTNRLLLQHDKKVIAIGESIVGSLSLPAITRLLPDGNLDMDFGHKILPQPEDHQPTAHFWYPTSDGCLQQDNKILIAAIYISNNNAGKDITRLYRLKDTGDKDEQFGLDQAGFIDIQFHGQPSNACAVQVQRTGKIVVLGTNGSFDTAMLARYSPSGELDKTFGEEGFVDISIERSIKRSSKKLLDHVNISPLSRLLILNDDRIVFTGFTIGPAKDRGVLMQLTADG